MTRPQKPYTPKPSKRSNSRPDKMRMSHIRLRDDLKRIEAEQAKAAAATPTAGRKQRP